MRTWFFQTFKNTHVHCCSVPSRSRPRDPDTAAPNARALGPEGYDPLWLQWRHVEAAVKPPIKDIFDSWAAKQHENSNQPFWDAKKPLPVTVPNEGFYRDHLFNMFI